MNLIFHANPRQLIPDLYITLSPMQMTVLYAWDVKNCEKHCQYLIHNARKTRHFSIKRSVE